MLKCYRRKVMLNPKKNFCLSKSATSYTVGSMRTALEPTHCSIACSVGSNPKYTIYKGVQTFLIHKELCKMLSLRMLELYLEATIGFVLKIQTRPHWGCPPTTKTSSPLEIPQFEFIWKLIPANLTSQLFKNKNTDPCKANVDILSPE